MERLLIHRLSKLIVLLFEHFNNAVHIQGDSE